MTHYGLYREGRRNYWRRDYILACCNLVTLDRFDTPLKWNSVWMNFEGFLTETGVVLFFVTSAVVFQTFILMFFLRERNIPTNKSVLVNLNSEEWSVNIISLHKRNLTRVVHASLVYSISSSLIQLGFAFCLILLSFYLFKSLFFYLLCNFIENNGLSDWDIW